MDIGYQIDGSYLIVLAGKIRYVEESPEYVKSLYIRAQIAEQNGDW